MKNKELIFIILMALSVGFFHISEGFCQDLNLEDATREIDRSIRKEAEEFLKPPEEKPQEPQVQEEQEIQGDKFFVKRIHFSGAEQLSEQEFKEMVREYENKELSLADLRVLAKNIQKKYLKKGIIAACYVPPQEIKNGIVVLKIVEAKAGQLHIQPHSYFNNDRLNYYWRSTPGELLRYKDIALSLHFMNKNPDRRAKATLFAGEELFTTDVRLDVDTSAPIHIFSSMDREGVNTSGHWRQGIGVRHNNFLNMDDTLLVGYKYGEHFDVPYVYHSVPITNYGTSILYGYNYSKAFPKKEYEIYAIDSRAKNASIFVHQDIMKGAEYAGDFHFGLDFKDKSVKYSGGTLNKDRLRILRTGFNVVYKDRVSITNFAPEISQGLNVFGAKRKTEYATRGAENTFLKFNFDIMHKRRLFNELSANINLKTQLASEKLMSQEQFNLGGISSVRGYPPTDYIADNAIQLNTEIIIPAFFIPKNARISFSEEPLQKITSIVLFADYAFGERIDPAPTEAKDAHLFGVGAGLRIRLPKRALLRLEWGFPIEQSTISEKSRSRFHFLIDISDMLPAWNNEEQKYYW